MMPATVEPIDELKAHALIYARQGFELFPLWPDKTPRTKNAFYDATVDLEQIEAWWSWWPDALIGCRIPLDLVLLDVDLRHGGGDTWRLIRETFGPPLTRAHRSGRGDGGGHAWWQRPTDKLSIKGLDDWAKEHGVGQAIGNRWVCGIDLLHHDHRYTILPPSPHPDTGKAYEWVKGRGLEFAALALPVDLAELISAEPTPDPPPRPPRIIDPDSPADWYSANHGQAETLSKHGWRVVAGDGNQDRSRWRHPTATASYSATISYGCLFVYSPNTEFKVTSPGDPHGYTSFATYALLDHGDDQSAAARAVRERRGLPVDAWSFVDHGARPSLTAVNGHHAAAEPEPVDELPEPPPWPEMPVEALHGILGDVVATLTPHTEADPAGILACLLTYFGASVGPGPHFRLSGANHNARVNMLVVGDSARARKGSAESMARWVMRTADPAIASERRATGLNSGEGLIDAVRDPRWGKDKTGADVLVDEGVPDKRLLLYEPEFAGRLLTAIKRSGSTISAILRTAWDDGNLQTMNSRNPLRATGAHVCVIGNVTMDELLNQTSPDDLAGGLLNRFLFVAVRSTRRLPFGGNIDDQTVEGLGRQVRDRLERARQRSRMDFGPSCLDVWPNTYDALMDDVPDGPLGHLTARGPVQVQRLALIYALADGAEAIEVDHLASAIAVWAYCRDSAQLIFTGDPAGRITGGVDGDQLLKLLVDSDRPWSVREIRDHFRWSGSKAAGERARLERLGLIKVGQIAREGGGRPKIVMVAR